MKRYHPHVLFLVFVVATAWTSWCSYQIAEREINNDLRQALALTKADAPVDWFTTDTIRQFRSHILSPELRRDAQLAFLLSDDGLLRVRGYVSYTSFQIWRMSDQRLSWGLAVMALVSLGLSMRRGPRWYRGIQGEGGDDGLASSCSMLRRDGELRGEDRGLRLTPMQEQLVGLLMSAPEGCMSKQDICQALWPGKPDASETLYTLVRRTKQALETEGRIRIASERGRSYRIEVG